MQDTLPKDCTICKAIYLPVLMYDPPSLVRLFEHVMLHVFY